MRRPCSAHLALGVTGLCLLATRSSVAQSFFQALGDLPTGDFYSQAYAVSADGSTVVGHSLVLIWPDQPFQRFQAFRWRRETGMVGLPFLRDWVGHHTPYGVSGDGTVVVGAAGLNTDDPDSRAVRWSASGEILDLGHFSNGLMFESGARSISDDASVIVGYDVLYPATAFRWTEKSGMQTLAGLPPQFSWAEDVSADASVIVGYTLTANQFLAFRWTATGWTILGDLPGGETVSVPSGVSGDGQVVVGYSNSANNPDRYSNEAFRWTSETGMVGLGDLPGGLFHSTAWDTNFDGSVVVGDSSTSLPGGSAFIWTADRGMRQLYEVLTRDSGLDLTGWWLVAASGVSADGRTIVGFGINPQGNMEGWIAHLGAACRADFNADGILDSRDFFDYLTAFLTTESCPRCEEVPPPPCPADFNHDCAVNSQDFFDFLAAFFAGC